MCNNCASDIPFIEGKVCKKCGLPLKVGDVCEKCMKRTFAFEYGFSAFTYDTVRKSIFRFKYSGVKNDGVGMAKLMEIFIRQNYSDLIDDINLIIPVPIHIKKLKSRGFNQADILARNLAEFLGKDYSSNTISRVKNTAPQNSLNYKERARNISDAFEFNKSIDVEDKSILIIDDIFTTGSTINECARLLMMNGAKAVYFYTFSIA